MTLEIKEVEDLAKLSLVIWSNSKLAQREFKAHDTVTEFLDNYTSHRWTAILFSLPASEQWQQSQGTHMWHFWWNTILWAAERAKYIKYTEYRTVIKKKISESKERGGSYELDRM